MAVPGVFFCWSEVRGKSQYIMQKLRVYAKVGGLKVSLGTDSL